MARRRTIHPEEQALWQTVARTARPLRPTRAVSGADLIAPQEKTPAAAPTPEFAVPLFRLGEKVRGSTAPRAPGSYADGSAKPPLRMDAKAFGKMTRGKLAPESRIDLHGMTLAEAHPALVSFVLSAFGAGQRLVLVITGKGKAKDDSGPIPQRTGILRHQVPQWLRIAPLGPVVLQVSEAHLRHGGSGALYVYLRRP
jgi:DNA-nicking Smr family endonuclease